MTGRAYSLHVNRLVSTSLILNEGVKYKSKVQKDFIFLNKSAGGRIAEGATEI